MDCPENDYICDSCLFEAHIANKLITLEQHIVMALESKPLRDHPHRVANEYLSDALVELDELWDDLIDDV